MRLEMNPKSILLCIISIPVLLVGVSALALAIFKVASSDQPVLERLNNIEVYYLVLLSFGLVAVATILASKADFFENRLIHKMFKVSMIVCSSIAGIMFIYSAMIFATSEI